jgi:transposase InsO family protein
MRIDSSIVEKVKKIDDDYRSTWDSRAIAYVTGISHGSVAKILKEYRGPRPERKEPPHDRRTKFLLRDVMWSSDVTGERDGYFLLKTIDEKTDYPLAWDLVRSENAEELVVHAKHLITRYGRTPLIWKYDNGSAFKSKKFQKFLKKHHIIPYPIHRRSPWTNGRTERDHQEIQRWLLPVPVKEFTREELLKEINEGMLMLNYNKPRAVLGFTTTARAYLKDKGVTEEDRSRLWAAMDRVHKEFVKYKHRKIVRTALQEAGLYEEWLENKKSA